MNLADHCWKATLNRFMVQFEGIDNSFGSYQYIER